MLNRRSFFSSIAAAVIGAPLVAKALTAVKPKATEPEPLARVDGANQVGTELIVRGAECFAVGDVITIQGIYPITPFSKQKYTTQPAVFIVAEVTSSSLHIQPPIITNGAYMNCSRSPEYGAGIDLFFPGMATAHKRMHKA